MRSVNYRGPEWIGLTSVNGSVAGGSSDFAYEQPVTLPRGTLTTLRLYLVSDLFGQGVKLGLYLAGVRIASAVALATTPGANYWLEIPTSTQPVLVAGNYVITANVFGNGADYEIGALLAQPLGTSFVSFSTTYAAMVQAALPNPDASLTVQFAVGALITP